MPDHPQFIADCATVAQEGACGYTAPNSSTTYQLMLPLPGGGVTTFTGMPFADPARAMGRIRGWLYNVQRKHGLPDGWGVAA
jgi:hypothetical protein